MGGTIRVESTEGVGTTFTAELPVGVPEQPANGYASVSERLQNKTALIIDGNASARNNLEQLLSDVGMAVTAVVDGTSALEAARRSAKPFDLCVVNHQLPDTDGFTLRQRLSSEAHQPMMTLMLLSFSELTTQSKRCVEQKLDGYTTKPVTRSALMQVFYDIFNPQASASTSGAGNGNSAPPVFTTAAGAAPRVLVADDNETNRFVISNMLSQRGIHAECVGDGLQALEMLEKQADFAFVFLDLQMPNMGGEEAVQHIRKSPKEYAKIPVIALTAHAMKGDAERCLAMGMSHYLSKPIESDKLDALLRQLAPLVEAARDAPPKTPPAPGPPPAVDGAIDERALMARFDNSVEFLTMAVEIFTRESAETVRQLARALAENSCDVAARHGHKLAGSVASMSHGRVLELVRKLEHQAKAGDLSGAQTTWTELAPEYQALCDALASLLKQRSGAST